MNDLYRLVSKVFIGKQNNMLTKITGARVLFPDDIVETDVLVDGERIVELDSSVLADRTIDGKGQLLAPAIVDIHGDAFERQMMPRPGVLFPLDAALLETDRQLATNGIATAYHALTLSWEPGLRSVERGEAFVDARDKLEHRLTVENRIQLRWETFAFEAFDLIERVLQGGLTPSLAFNDHTSMSMRSLELPVQERLFEHNPAFGVADTHSPKFANRISSSAKRAGLETDQYRDLINSIWDRRAEVPAMIERVAGIARARSAPMLSHDDTQDETRDYFRSLGATISEFPMRISVARAAKTAGDAIVFGAPNVVRGGSHIGSVHAGDMVEDGLCDILASDYFYPAMLAAVARLAEEKRAPLHQLWSLVSIGPALASGLRDRGDIAVGKRADLVLIDWPQGAPPAVTLTMAAGRVAYHAAR